MRSHSLNTCSYGLLQFPEPDNPIYGPIDLNCTGSWPGLGAYDLINGVEKDKYHIEMQVLNAAARAHVQKEDPLTFNIFPYYGRKILFWPIDAFGKNQVVGLADTGCLPSRYENLCRSCLFPKDLDVANAFHELGHNMGLQHADRLVCNASSVQGVLCEVWHQDDPTDPMGSVSFDGAHKDGYRYVCLSAPHDDPTDPMGSVSFDGAHKDGYRYVCLSAPHAYRAGWASPQSINMYFDLQVGNEQQYTIPSMARTNTGNMLRIEVDDKTAIFVSYRVRSKDDYPGRPGFDSGLKEDLDHTVW
ncbi:hypothetical protein GPECTOR_27g675 [Gonium pectorale]|uniref:Uncharacterized protein n=1 Tax=Gonium pectorale TaxID=33097 RepID=A0A150GFY2_GONPE|nr:hypothetical protein GPECTOR_27g675 [Gonium pectorale]|eukprot:KXZ48505.1 hypothetical protein GPECTOR_27g675 [Gonium pectorale]